MSAAAFLDKINPRLRKINFLISAILVTIFFLVLLIHLNKQVRDLDIWLHLKTGQQILAAKAIMLTDQFSFTKQNAPWTNHEWLFQVLSYTIYKYSGFDGLLILQNIVFMAVFLIMFIIGMRNKRFLFVSAMLFILLLNSSYRFTLRPDMFSVLFLVIFIFILKEKKKYLYILPLIQIIWSNTHGFFFIGPLVILIFALTEKNRKLLFIFILSLLATTVNPQFVKGALYPLTILAGLFKDRIIFDFIQELKRPITLDTLFNIKSWFFYKALIIISAFSFRFNQKKFNLTLFLLWLVFLLFSLFAIRNIIYFAMVAIITIFYNANERFSHDNQFSNERIKDKNYYFITRYSMIFVFSLCMIKNAMINMDCRYYDFEKYGFRSCMWGVSLRDFPNKAVDFIIKEKLPQRLFNDFNSGSYLVGRAFPARKVFIDGRTEFYGNSFLKDYRAVTKGDKEKIQKIIAKYGLEGFLLSISASNFDKELAGYLFKQPNWKVVYFDDKAMIFLKYDKNNKNLIKKFGINLKEWSAPKIKLERIGPRVVYPYSHIMRGKVLKELGCFQAGISEAKEALKIMPNSIEALEILGDCYFGLKEYKAALENYRLALTLNPGDAGLRNNFALSLYRLGYLLESETQLLKIIKQRPKDAQNYYALALVYKKQNKLQQAQKMIKTACLYSKNKNFEYLKLWADILLELKDYREALKVYKLAQQLNTEDNQIRETIENIEKTL